MTIRPQDIFGGTGSIVDSIGGRKNYIIDGNFDFWDEGNGPFTSNGYTATLWYSQSGGSSHSVTKQEFTVSQSEVPNNPTNFYRHVVTSVSGASNYSRMQHYVEDVSKLSGEDITLSFWARADSAKDIAIELQQNFNSSPASVTEIGVTKVSLTTSWQKFSVQVSVPDCPSGATIGSLTSTVIGFWFDAGSDLDSRTDTLGNQSGTFDIAQVQLEKGSIATDFEYRSYGEELALVQRYYTYDNSIQGFQQGGYSVSGSNETTSVYFPTEMRVVPTVSILISGSGGFDTTPTLLVQSNRNFHIYLTCNLTGNTFFRGSYTADARF